MRLLRTSYSLIAPWYDLLIASATRAPRRRSLERIPSHAAHRVLIVGIGSGLDLPLLPSPAPVVGLDLTPAMLRRARRRSLAGGRADLLVVGDANALPFRDAAFDAVVLHLLLAVVPRPAEALAEASRVVALGGRVLVWDKFLRAGARAPIRRLAGRVLGPLLTRTDVVFDDLLAGAPALAVVDDRPSLFGGWFRFITLERRGRRTP